MLWRLPRGTAYAAAGLTLPLGLMLHPSILEHYSVLLLFPLFLAWSEAGRPLARQAVVFLTVEYALIGIGDGQWVFVATALCWLWFAWVAADERRRFSSRPDSAMAAP